MLVPCNLLGPWDTRCLRDIDDFMQSDSKLKESIIFWASEAPFSSQYNI